jgi:hypothetical protein
MSRSNPRRLVPSRSPLDLDATIADRFARAMGERRCGRAMEY